MGGRCPRPVRRDDCHHDHPDLGEALGFRNDHPESGSGPHRRKAGKHGPSRITRKAHKPDEARESPSVERSHNGRRRQENMMAKYLFLKHYRGGPAPTVPFASMDQWAPDEVDAHLQYMRDFTARLKETGEFVDEQALATRRRVRALRRRGTTTRHRRPVRRNQRPDRRMVHHRRRVVGPCGTTGRRTVGGPRTRWHTDLRMVGGSTVLQRTADR